MAGKPLGEPIDSYPRSRVTGKPKVIPHPDRIGPVKRDYRNVWSAAELQAKNEKWQLVCANVFGL
jgi:hypothetical protein